MVVLFIDLLGTYAQEMAARIGEKSGKPAIAPDRILPVILQDSAFLDWHECKAKFDHLHAAPDRRFTRSSFGNIIATEETAWNDSGYGYSTTAQAKINWSRLGTTIHGIKEIEAGFNRCKLDAPGLKSWLVATDASRARGRRAESDKLLEQGKRYIRWTHDAPFVARIERGPAQACATIRSQLRVPEFICKDPVDGVLRAEIEVLQLTQHGPLISVPRASWYYGRNEKPNEPTSHQELQKLLEKSLPMLLAGAARDLLKTIYLQTDAATDDDGDWGSQRIPTVNLTVNIPERLAGQERAVAEATLKALKNPIGEYHGHDDEMARLASLTVAVLSDGQQAQRLSELQAQKDEVRNHQLQAAAKKALLQPGEEFTLIQIELSVLTVGADGRFYPTRMYQVLGELYNEAGLSPTEILRMAQASPEWLDRASDYHAVDQWMSKAAALVQEHPDWQFDEDSITNARDCIETALQLRGLPPQTDRAPPTIWLVIDTATLFPYAELGSGDTDLAALLQRATDPAHPLAMGADPKRLKVAAAVLQSHAELQAWARSREVELVRPKSGFDAGSMHVKFWRKMVESVASWGLSWGLEEEDRNWWNGVNSISEQGLVKAIRQRVELHQDPGFGSLDQNDFARIKWYIYRDGIDSVKAQKYLDWRLGRRGGAKAN